MASQRELHGWSEIRARNARCSVPLIRYVQSPTGPNDDHENQEGSA
jgi:hypothetical protein